ncbi:MAG: histidinol-phosphatase [Pirellulaceae bacterium]|nr:MAG: histidinol-phosphatase [Pirellulaceae bacterium]
MNECRQPLPTPIRSALDGRVAAAVRLALSAGADTLKFFQDSNLRVERKQDRSPVTEADRQAELLIREALGQEFPDDAILGEEFGSQGGESEYQWIIDPIDGTKSFICGVPLYSTLIAVVRGRQAVAGVIYLPALDEIVVAATGCGAWHATAKAAWHPARVSDRDLEVGLFTTSQVDSFWQRGAEAAYRELERRASITRTWGDGYGYLLVATGRAELMVDPVANPWDLAPVEVVVREAGGRFTDWSGEPTAFGGDGVASNGIVHDQALALLRPSNA